MLSFQDLVAGGEHLGVHPDAMTSLLEIMEDPVVDADTLLPIVECDPGLTAGLLKLCNSPVLGLRREVDSVRQALVLLGNYAFARFAFVVGVDRMIQADLTAYRLTSDEIRDHGLAVGYAAARLAAAVGLGERRLQIFTAGMLHDCGKILLDPHLRGRVAADAHGGRGRVDPAVEVAYTGYDHGKAGAALLASWGLPQPVVQAVRCHHRLDAAGNYRSLSGIVWAADMVVHLAAEGAELDPEDPDSPHRSFLAEGMSPQVILDMLASIPRTSQEILALAARG